MTGGMKIVYIIFSISKMTGIERMFVSQVNYLAEQFGYDMTLMTYDQGDAPDAYPLSPKVSHIDFNLKTFHIYRYPLPIRPFIKMKWNRKLGDLIRNTVSHIAPDIVVCSSYEISEMRIVLSLKNVKRVVQIHSSYLQSGGRLRSRHIESGIRLLYNRLFVFHRVVRLVRQFDSIVALTHGDAKLWRSPRVTVIPNALAIETVSKQCERKKKVIAVGSLLMVKGFDMLIEAWRKVCVNHPDWLLEITGEGVEEPHLLQQIESLPSVRILPKTADIGSRYQSGEIFVLSSRYEGFGLVLLEAMSYGLACVSFDCDFGPREIITDGKDGYLVSLGDIDALAERIEYLMNHENDRRRIGENAVIKASQYRIDKIMSLWKQHYESLKGTGV